LCCTSRYLRFSNPGPNHEIGVSTDTVTPTPAEVAEALDDALGYLQTAAELTRLARDMALKAVALLVGGRPAGAVSGSRTRPEGFWLHEASRSRSKNGQLRSGRYAGSVISA
jgi:hypothetical protein